MKSIIKLIAIATGCAAFTACSMNPLALGYRSASGVEKREWVNTNPNLVQPSMSGHSSTVSHYTSKGYRVIGYGQMNARYEVDSQNARLLATEKNADVAVFSRRYLGKQTETVQVPVATTTTTASSQYANSNQYASQSEAGVSTTVYQYQNQKYDLWEHKTTLLRGK